MLEGVRSFVIPVVGQTVLKRHAHIAGFDPRSQRQANILINIVDRESHFQASGFVLQIDLLPKGRGVGDKFKLESGWKPVARTSPADQKTSRDGYRYYTHCEQRRSRRRGACW